MESFPKVEISIHECKGCGLCIAACPKKVLQLEQEGKLNKIGYNYCTYIGEGCIGCGICYNACPEPSTITVIKKKGA